MKRILNCAKIYEFYQKTVGMPKLLKILVNNHLRISSGMSLLDLGCGTANVFKHLPEGVIYTGLDKSEKYIKYNRKKYPNHTFLCEDIEKMESFDKTYDIVYLEAIISALDDELTKKLFKLIQTAATSKTRIVIADMNYYEGACFLQKFLQKNERNSFVRTKDDYIKLLSPYFNIDKTVVIEGVLNIPYSSVVFECSLKD